MLREEGGARALGSLRTRSSESVEKWSSRGRKKTPAGRLTRRVANAAGAMTAFAKTVSVVEELEKELRAVSNEPSKQVLDSIAGRLVELKATVDKFVKTASETDPDKKLYGEFKKFVRTSEATPVPASLWLERHRTRRLDA